MYLIGTMPNLHVKRIASTGCIFLNRGYFFKYITFKPLENSTNVLKDSKGS